ncbi:MAG: DNA polymerase [Mycoplasma sp.]
MGKSRNYTLDRNNWFIADFETTTEKTEYYKNNDDVCVVLSGLKRFRSNEEVEVFLGIEAFIEKLFEDRESKTVFFHNLSFDGDFIVKYLVKKLGFSLDFRKTTGKRIEVFKSDSNILSIKLYHNIKKDGVAKKFQIIFRCSLKMLSCGVEKLGKDLGMNKHNVETDYDGFYDVDPVKNIEDLEKEYVEYCKRDILIVEEALKIVEDSIKTCDSVKYYESKNKYFNFFHYMTAGSLAMGLIKNIYLNDYNVDNQISIKLNIEKDDYEYLKPFMSGGLTQVSPKFLGGDVQFVKGRFIDINSSFPSGMVMELPYGELLTKKPRNSHYQEFYEIRVKHIKIKEECKNFICFKDWKNSSFRYITEARDFTCYYTKEEWEFYHKIYDIKVESITSTFMRTAPYLKNFIEEMYHYKTKYKNEGKSGMALIFKIILNSSYGKFATREKFKNIIFCETDLDTEFIHQGEKYYRVLNKSKANDVGVNTYNTMPVADPKKYSNIGCASVITSRARVKLMEAVYDIGCDNFIYCDTDSILFKNENNEDKNIVYSDELGYWSKEYDITDFKCYGAKKYVCYSNGKVVKLAMSGININELKIKNKKGEAQKMGWDMEKIDNLNFAKDELSLKDIVINKVYCNSGILLKVMDKKFKKGTN